MFSFSRNLLSHGLRRPSGGVWQAVVSWLQYGEVLSSNHSEFPVTGNFANPAHLGAYLGLAMLCTGYLLYSCYRQKRYMLCICLSAGLLAMGGIFLLAFSRASWVALVAVLLFGVWKGNRLKIRMFLCFFLLLFRDTAFAVSFFECIFRELRCQNKTKSEFCVFSA